MMIRMVIDGVTYHYCSPCATDEGIDTSEGRWVRGGWCAVCGHVDGQTGPLGHLARAIGIGKGGLAELNGLLKGE